MVEDLLNDYRVLNAGDDFEGPAASTTGLNVDIENPLETLCPRHGRPRFGGGALSRPIHSLGLAAFAPLGGRYLGAMAAVCGEFALPRTIRLIIRGLQPVRSSLRCPHA